MARFAAAKLTCALSLIPALGLAQDVVFSEMDWVVEQGDLVQVLVDQGGSITLYEDFFWANQTRMFVIAGTCVSSCTMFLGAQNVCVEADAAIGFHGPSTDSENPGRMTNLVMRISALYPEPLRKPFQDLWSRSEAITWLTGAQVHDLAPAVALCPMDSFGEEE